MRSDENGSQGSSDYAPPAAGSVATTAHGNDEAREDVALASRFQGRSSDEEMLRMPTLEVLEPVCYRIMSNDNGEASTRFFVTKIRSSDLPIARMLWTNLVQSNRRSQRGAWLGNFGDDGEVVRDEGAIPGDNEFRLIYTTSEATPLSRIKPSTMSPEHLVQLFVRLASNLDVLTTNRLRYRALATMEDLDLIGIVRCPQGPSDVQLQLLVPALVERVTGHIPAVSDCIANLVSLWFSSDYAVTGAFWTSVMRGIYNQLLPSTLARIGEKAAEEGEVAAYLWARGYFRSFVARSHESRSRTATSDCHRSGGDSNTGGVAASSTLSDSSVRVHRSSASRSTSLLQSFATTSGMGATETFRDVTMVNGLCWLYASAFSAALLRGRSRNPQDLKALLRLEATIRHELHLFRSHYARDNVAGNRLFLDRGDCSFDLLLKSAGARTKKVDDPITAFIRALNVRADQFPRKVLSLKRYDYASAELLDLRLGDLIVLTRDAMDPTLERPPHLVSFLQQQVADADGLLSVLTFDCLATDSTRNVRRYFETTGPLANLMAELQGVESVLRPESDMVVSDHGDRNRLVEHRLSFPLIIFRLEVPDDEPTPSNATSAAA